MRKVPTPNQQQQCIGKSHKNNVFYYIICVYQKSKRDLSAYLFKNLPNIYNDRSHNSLNYLFYFAGLKFPMRKHKSIFVSSRQCVSVHLVSGEFSNLQAAIFSTRNVIMCRPFNFAEGVFPANVNAFRTLRSVQEH